MSQLSNGPVSRVNVSTPTAANLLQGPTLKQRAIPILMIQLESHGLPLIQPQELRALQLLAYLLVSKHDVLLRVNQSDYNRRC